MNNRRRFVLRNLLIAFLRSFVTEQLITGELQDCRQLSLPKEIAKTLFRTSIVRFIVSFKKLSLVTKYSFYYVPIKRRKVLTTSHHLGTMYRCDCMD